MRVWADMTLFVCMMGLHMMESNEKIVRTSPCVANAITLFEMGKFSSSSTAACTHKFLIDIGGLHLQKTRPTRFSRVEKRELALPCTDYLCFGLEGLVGEKQE